jgi:hypothetical protein
MQLALTQRTSNGTIRWSVGSPPDTTTVQQDRSRLTSHKASLQSQNSSSTFNLQTFKHYYKPGSNSSKLIQTVFKLTSRTACPNSQRKEKIRDYTRRESGHHAQPKAWCHSGGSLPAGDGSHSTDQPKGTDVGHAGLSMGFSKVIPETDTSKAEHSNTQQGLPEFGYNLARN